MGRCINLLYVFELVIINICENKENIEWNFIKKFYEESRVISFLKINFRNKRNIFFSPIFITIENFNSWFNGKAKRFLHFVVIFQLLESRWPRFYREFWIHPVYIQYFWLIKKKRERKKSKLMANRSISILWKWLF